VLLAALGAPETPAPPEPATPQLFMRGELYGGWGPKAALARYTLSYRHTYLRRPERDLGSRLLDRTYVEGGFSLDITAPFGRYGLYAEWLPLQVLRLRADAGVYTYHGWIRCRSRCA
jgi:hypothetical protein